MDNRTLLHTKAKQIKVSNSSPINSDGQNGDMQLIVSSNIDNNELLYIKINNEWKIIGLENKPNFSSGRIIPNVDKIQHKGKDIIEISSSQAHSNINILGAFGVSSRKKTFITFLASDTTPSVSESNLFKTHASTQTLTMFDDGIVGQIINIISTAAVTYDVTSTSLKGGSTNIVTASGDMTTWVFDGTNWYLMNFMDVSADLSSGH